MGLLELEPVNSDLQRGRKQPAHQALITPSVGPDVEYYSCCSRWSKFKTITKVGAYSLEGEVALRDHLSDLSDDLTLGVGQINPLLAHINLTCFAVLSGLLSLSAEERQLNSYSQVTS